MSTQAPAHPPEDDEAEALAELLAESLGDDSPEAVAMLQTLMEAMLSGEDEDEDDAAANAPLPDTATAPLAQLAQHLGHRQAISYADFARLLLTRLDDGREAEVVDFFRDTEIRHIHQLSHLRDDAAPWLQDDASWRRFARLSIPRGVLFDRSREIPRRDAALSQELRGLAAQWLERSRQDNTSARELVGFVIARLLPLMHYPDMSREDCLAHVEWALALRAEGGIRPADDYNTGWKAFIESLSDVRDLIALAEHGGRLRATVLNVHQNRLHEDEIPTPTGWAPWHDFFTRHPQAYEETPIPDAGLIALRWPHSNATQREALADRLLSEISWHRPAERDYIRSVFDRLMEDDAEVFAAQLRGEYGHYDISANLARWVFERQDAALLPLLLPTIAPNCKNADEDADDEESEAGSYREVVNALVRSRPADLEQVATKELPNLLPLLDQASLQAALPSLTRIITGSSSKALREALTRAAHRFAPADLHAAGWTRKPPKNLLLVCRDVLLAHPDPAAGPLLTELLASGKLDVASASQVEERLQQLGLGDAPTGAAAVDTPSADPADGLATLEAQAATVKRIAAAVKHFDDPATLALLAPLSEHAAHVVLHLAATCEDSLPPLAGKLLAPVPAPQRAAFALSLVNSWIGSEGDPKLRWALRLMRDNADDRVADQLVAAIQAWNRPRLQRAAAATEQLGEVDSLYALLRVQEISESRKLKDLVQRSARGALRAAARRRQMSVPELFDELTPDFGLGEGLTLSVGPQVYRIELQGDLSLRVINDKGKAGKSIPAVRDAALKTEHEAASARLKTLASSLKTVVKQQAPRMHAALVSGKRWPLDRWQRLFVQHPLLRIVGRSLIWRAEDAPGLVRTSLRIAEDFSLVDVEDEAITLPAGCSLSLWHPATAAAGEREAWQAYFADYEMEPMVDQLGACAELPPAEWFRDEVLAAPAGLQLTQENLAGLLKKWGYRPGPVGDGPSINEHTWRLPALEMSIELDHGYFPPWMDIGHPVDIGGFRIRDLSQDWAWVKPADLPKPLQATLMGQIQALQAKAITDA